MHELSSTNDGTFIREDCGTVPESLIERELTGGLGTDGAEKIGFLQMAQSGTLYLQGVDELSLASQTILMKKIQETNVNFRIICATEQDLEELMAEKQFREDLFYLLRSEEHTSELQ